MPGRSRVARRLPLEAERGFSELAGGFVLPSGMRPATWLSLILVAACTPETPPAGPPQAAPVRSAPLPLAAVTASAAPAPPAAPAPGDEACLAGSVKLSGKLAAKPVDPALPSRLAACGASPKPDECRYSVAGAYFKANHFDEAGGLFRDIALSGDRELGVYAGTLYLECLSVLGSHVDPPLPTRLDEMAAATVQERRDPTSSPGLPTCWDEMAAATPRLKARHCTTEARDQEFCQRLDAIEIDLQRFAADKLIQKADAGGTDALSLYRQGGELYMALFDRVCAFRAPDKKHKPAAPPGWPGERCAEIGYFALKSFQAAKEPAAAESARAALLNPVNRLHATELAKRAAIK